MLPSIRQSVQVWVFDSNVGRVRDDARTDVEKVVEEVASIPLPVPSRKVCIVLESLQIYVQDSRTGYGRPSVSPWP